MLTIFNAALLSQGQEPLIGVNDGSNEWRVLSANWPPIVEAELEAGGYHFTREWSTLLNRSAGGFGYDDAYLVPAGTLHVREVCAITPSGDLSVDWLQDATHVHATAPTGVRAERVVVHEPHLWTALFRRGIQLKMEALILRSIKEEYGAARETDAMAEMSLQDARTSSSRAKSEQPFHRDGGTFVDARRRRG
jgi:hypothetical protein